MAWRRHVVQHYETRARWRGRLQVLKGLCRVEKEIDIWKVCKLCLEGEIPCLPGADC